ncbi:vWA domain-containing protein [Pseudonocardia humida]|uniref:VWA domain-containing protein n=1 Tax=Pseudonocardia humida TaxID=2800819 RepID=A0ABT1A3F7_9PSEU|nr:VWA domain-containing protein [Pseudonocardia humida]MCO1657483.1 VWA domain-containing protein [Pseudonocardia humida]
MSAPQPSFSVEVDQNPYLHVGATQVDAIVTVTASGAGSAAGATGGAVEIIVVDCSASMSGGKIHAAREATAAAVGQIRDGVEFAVVAGTHDAAQIYPRTGTATADATTRREAANAARRLRAGGGTSIGVWLTLARRIAERHPGAVRHAILLTDGQNGEPPEVLERVLAECAGGFVCDCRGVGTDWDVEELRRISSALLGGFEFIREPADLADDFARMMSTAMAKGLADVELRLWTPKGSRVRFVKQVDPDISDLTDRRTESGRPGAPAAQGDYPLGVWGDETRIYHVCLEVPAQAVGAEMLAGRVSLRRSGASDVLGQGMVKAIWTDDPGLSTRISRQVAHFTGQARLADSIQVGLAALRDGDERTATARLGEAVRLATESGNDGTARLLERVVLVEDAPTGSVRLRAGVDKADAMSLDTRSTKTVRVRGTG